MALPGRTSEVLPFTLTEIFVLLVFLLLLLFVASTPRIELAQQCLDAAGPSQVCIPVDSSQVPEPGQTLISVDTSQVPEEGQEFVSVDPSQVPEPGQTLISVDTSQVPEEGQEFVSVDPSQVPEPGQTLISVDTSQVPEEGQEFVSVDPSQVPGPGEILVPLDSTWVRLKEAVDQSAPLTEETLRCLEEVEPGQECQPIDITKIVVDRRFGPVIDSVLANPAIDPGDYPNLNFDLPNVEKGPCWRNPQDVLVSENVEEIYSFEVDMTPSSLTFTKVWPPRYNSYADTVPGLNELSELGTVDFATYHREGRKILEWSDNQRPPCRLYVDIFYSLSAFESETDPIGASNDVETLVETYFYKRTNARARNNR